jgi:hypothetical protein
MSTWCLWGISAPKKFVDASYSAQTVWGIAGSNQSYANGVCKYDVQTTKFYGKEEVYIDMLLDLNKCELKFKLVSSNEEYEAKMVNIPNNQHDGWVPHMNIYYAGANCQIKKIPTAWYGKNPTRVKFQY